MPMKITRDKSFERLIKLTKGKNTKKITEIHKRHTNSEDMSIQSVTVTGERTWDVLSSCGTQLYTVTLENRVCPEKCGCGLVCRNCYAFIHSYTCTCNDYIPLGDMCKHIHLTVTYQRQ